MHNDTVTASEIGEWVFCPEAFRLRALGHQSANQPQLIAGTVEHAHKATAERLAGGSIAFGRILIFIALLALAVAFLWR